MAYVLPDVFLNTNQTVDLFGENFPPQLPSQEVEEVERSNDAEGRVVSGFLG